MWGKLKIGVDTSWLTKAFVLTQVDDAGVLMGLLTPPGATWGVIRKQTKTLLGVGCFG